MITELNRQIKEGNFQDRVQLVGILDTYELKVGEKRNSLIDLCNGQYVMFIDDDDKIAYNFVSKILTGCSSGCDVVTFCGEYLEGGIHHSDFMISKQIVLDYNEHKKMYRRPNHLCAVRRDIALQCKFPAINFREDSHYSEAINKLIINEYHIPEKLYFYFFDSNKSQTHNRNN